MFGSLDASNFSGCVPFYDNEFEKILSKITICYQLMKTDKVVLENDENKIRDVLVNNYINNPKIKQDLQLNYFFFPEVPESKTSGRTDIRIHNPNSFLNQNEEYYIIECKRLDNTNTVGTSGLNAKYIENGIDRFITKCYSSYYRVNGMIGFIVEDLKIDENVKSINVLLTTSFSSIITKQEITKDSFIDEFEYHYSSIHTDEDNDELKIYHLMFNLSENIQT
ncbi:MAG: hypothetical protein CMC96_00460 [Flavobacteriales bacterium]|nr:hypothetical protein [Flavobacteriales bacterium]|tara:strand:+ start:55202 stop:55870 length:669 start_codon:yes stop_codon:yes gene_type:complete